MEDEADHIHEEGHDVEDELRGVDLVDGVQGVVDARRIDPVPVRGVAVHIPAEEREIEERLHPVPPHKEHHEQEALEGVLRDDKRLEAARKFCGVEIDVKVTVRDQLGKTKKEKCKVVVIGGVIKDV